MMGIIANIIFTMLGRNRVLYLLEIFFNRLLSESENSSKVNQLNFLAQKFEIESADKIRVLECTKTSIPTLLSYDGSEPLRVYVQSLQAPWLAVSRPSSDIPGMITAEEECYYLYIGKFYSGAGAIIEIGPWLGRSTYFISEGLKNNPNFNQKKLHVYDDFVWRSEWMSKYVSEENRLPNHSDFQPMFQKYTGGFSDKLSVHKQKLSVYDGNQNVENFQWNGEKIEAIYVDCGRTFEVNSTWYKLLRPYFIPGKTLLILQDWRQHREVPKLWYNQIKQFTESLDHEIVLVHEISSGGIASFLFKPNDSGK